MKKLLQKMIKMCPRTLAIANKIFHSEIFANKKIEKIQKCRKFQTQTFRRFNQATSFGGTSRKKKKC